MESEDLLEDLLFRALERLDRDGDAAIDELCGGDAARAALLRREISKLRGMGLLEPSEDAQDFPERLGEFRLIERLGAGGMGVVFVAEQTSLGRTVALKVIRPELTYFPGQRERFRREVEAVAAMQHPGIVPVHTVGEEGGVLYFTMERIEGRSLGELLAELRGRDPRTLRGSDLAELLGVEPGVFPHGWVETCVRIVRQIAEALEHAHGRGVVHRDVKPSNVSITRGGRAMLLDFGLARRGGADDDSLTRSGSQPGSLPYMSPEQVRGDDVDARTDVYSLGVTFYELLTLRAAFPEDSASATTRRIETGEVASVAALNPHVPRDARVVCAAAMEPDRGRRYATANDLARDLGNLLAHRPIEARRTGPWLRVLRWSQRHPTGSVAAVLVLLLTAAAAVSFAWQRDVHAGQLKVERDLQAARAREAERVSDFLVELIQSANPNVRPEEVTVVQLLDEGAAAIRGELDEEPLVRARVLHAIGRAYAALGVSDKGRPLLRGAFELRAEVLGDDHPETLAARLDLARATIEHDLEQAEAAILDVRERAASIEDPATGLVARAALADLRRGEGRWDEAVVLYEEVHSGWIAALGEESVTAVEAGEDLAYLYMLAGRYDEALPLFERALEVHAARSGADHPATLEAHQRLGLLHSSWGRHDEALVHLEEARAGRERVLGPRHVAALESRASIANELKELGRLDEALAAHDVLLEEFTREFGLESPRTLRVRGARARVLSSLGRHRESLEEATDVLILREEVLGPDHPHTGSSRLEVGTELVLLGRYEEAIPVLEEAIAKADASLGADHDTTLSAMNSLAGAYYLTKRRDEALDWTERVLAGRLRTKGPDHAATLGARDNLARLLIAAGDFERAEEEMLAVRARRSAALGEEHVDTLLSGGSLGHLYLRWERYGAAEEVLAATRAAMERVLGAGHPHRLSVVIDLGTARLEDGRPGEALECYREALEGLRAAFGPRHPESRKALRGVAVSLLDLGRPADARPHLIELIELTPPGDPALIEFREALADVEAILASEPQK